MSKVMVQTPFPAASLPFKNGELLNRTGPMNALPTPTAPAWGDPHVLLIFVPGAGERLLSPESASLDEVLAQLADWVRVTRVDARAHPEVTHSFGVGRVPAFVLLSKGKEIWRYDGPINAGLSEQLLGLSLLPAPLLPRL
jgi:hypothetical protein